MYKIKNFYIIILFCFFYSTLQSEGSLTILEFYNHLESDKIINRNGNWMLSSQASRLFQVGEFKWDIIIVDNRNGYIRIHGSQSVSDGKNREYALYKNKKNEFILAKSTYDS